VKIYTVLSLLLVMPSVTVANHHSKSLFKLCSQNTIELLVNNKISPDQLNTLSQDIKDCLKPELIKYNGSLFWSALKDKAIQHIVYHKDNVASVAISADNSFIVTGSHDNTVRVWDISTGKCRAILTGHTGPITSVAISADNSFIVTGSGDNTARVWDAPTGKCTATLTGHNRWVLSVAISTDNNFIVTGSKDNTARVWDVKTGQCIATLAGHTREVTLVAISSDSSFIVTGSWDNTVQVLNIAQAIEKMTFEEALALAIIPKLRADQDQAAWLSFLHGLSIYELYSLAACLPHVLPHALPRARP
jgi:WD40 repeat protein